MVRPGLFVAVGLGSALGAVLRFSASLWLVTADTSLPLATLVVNIVGSFWIGCYVMLTADNGCWQVSVWQRQFMLSDKARHCSLYKNQPASCAARTGLILAFCCF